MIRKLLIANRGEIACRIIKTARRLGVATVAVYSDADADALHVQMADEAVRLGPPPAKASYLDMEKVIDAARQTGADAIHPGYGFLSENAEFCRACDRAGIVFVGPPAGAIEAMGSKSAAKRIMEEAGVPLVPGYHGTNQDVHILEGHANRIGYPVLLKAAAGGGGKGMRRVDSAEEFQDALAAAKREAMNAFGDDQMLLERYVVSPRHVEIQVFCDQQGKGVYLFERDCSVQRRHQKVVEEAPAPGLSEELRARMGEAALRAAHAIGYTGAGTVEFLLDASGAFYFMEMNTRLQVEHPVTEMITGQDLVAWQLSVAAGEPLPLGQDDLHILGHAFEVRIYAEDPDNDFLPATGTLVRHRPPKESESVRVDTGVQSGDEISVHYDPMIAKLICHGRSRKEALAKLDRALQEYQIAGVRHNIEFLRRVINHRAFASGRVSTHFIGDYEADILQQEQQLTPLKCAAIAGYLHMRETRDLRASAPAADPHSPWHSGDDWRPGIDARRVHSIDYRGHRAEIASVAGAGGVHWQCDALQSDCKSGEIRILPERELALVDGRRVSFSWVDTACGGAIFIDGIQVEFELLPPDIGESGDQAHGLEAPMNGTIIALLVAPGAQVEKDQPLLVMEAMKMEHTLRAPTAGKVQQFLCAEGELVDGGSLLIDFAEEE
ncbi:acetyl/propionyl/methylcrotonyl-CoA carboxylase subunit alpha [Microbulbifer thermotolerans]|uniref:Biotin carboxylase n=1 Tax=Microbulbifer thermotolerans TaxID=252514 RepID=A0AB35HV82_MICTH|nr:acetyl/propionyl/methylcrotonyl-CoA carboxylase subunit alpha [Microbulbifer thermotolerans]MCX2781981.1 acetyl/propionyl/methylcrotonyl-CoA carboxylase subunit alpha [Microbulbifer thermotolerans]MCX2783261.1 acetyl/propionyl/methylcrotonyl-CoA carboxylase subunit alpha [Microbulbifer thermotolerans]MCX2800343.1 acetyl/propionyl/methylcrotonyl-CoA carboxylase subunit alpha [Microbulbifer thermotolerans]SFC38704.1 3-methylcrotonyl-CoA carboxylase alpha subunit [Microbulbifer thermotolerans]